MTIELISVTDDMETYGLYDAAGKCLGTKEVMTAGCFAGETFYYTVSGVSRLQVKKCFMEIENAA